MQWTVTRNMRRLSVGQVVYTPMVYDTGGMIDEGTVLRLGENNFRWVGGTDYSGIWLRQQGEERGLRALGEIITPRSSATFRFKVPKAGSF